MGSHLRYRRAGAAAAAALLTFALVACGSDSSAEGDNQGGSGEASPTPSPTPTGYSGPWKADPGQADRVQQKLTAAGYECTRSSDPELDLRLCSLGKMQKVEGEYRGSESLVRFASDAQGTVVLANLRSYGPTKEQQAQDKIMAEALLPASDAAVFLANGDTLEWGKRIDNRDNGDYLAVKGWAPSPNALVPKFSPLQTTKEKALPVLQQSKLKCEFSDTDSFGGKRQALECKDPTFRVKQEDGSMSGARAELALIDNGEGIETLHFEGAHSRIPAENARGVKLLLPAAKTVDPQLVEVADWIEKHLDAAPHSAYVGQWLVDIRVVPTGGLIGWPYVKATVSLEKLNLGLDPKGVEWEVPGDSVSPTNGSSPTDGASPEDSATPAG